MITKIACAILGAVTVQGQGAPADDGLGTTAFHAGGKQLQFGDTEQFSETPLPPQPPLANPIEFFTNQQYWVDRFWDGFKHPHYTPCHNGQDSYTEPCVFQVKRQTGFNNENDFNQLVECRDFGATVTCVDSCLVCRVVDPVSAKVHDEVCNAII